MAAVIGSLRAELSASIAKFQADMGAAAKSVQDFARVFDKTGKDFKKIGAQMESVGAALTKSITLPLAAIGGAAAKVGIDFESAFAGVRKTVTATEPELQAMARGFRDLAKTIPVSVNELARLGEAAGALGIPKAEIVEFSRVMALLGVTTNVTSDQAAESIAKIQTQFGAAGKDTERFASTLVALGNSGASTEQEILALAARVASAGNAVGLSQQQVLGFASAIANVGIEAEAGGSAMSRVFVDLAGAVSTGGDAVAGFARVAGQSVEQFRKAFQTDAAGATQTFIEGLGRIKASGGDLIGTLNDLGFTEIRQADLLRRLAQSGDNLAVSLRNSNDAWRENSALSAEAGKRFETTASKLQVLGNRLTDIGITIFSALKPGIEAAIGLVNDLLPVIERLAQQFAHLPGPVQLAVFGVAAFAAAIGPAIFVAGQLVSSLGTLTLAFGKNGIATRALLAAFAALGGGGATAATGVGLLASALGPLAIVVGGVAGALYLFNQRLNQMEQGSSAGKPLKDLQDDFGKTKLTIQDATTQLRAMSGELPAFATGIKVLGDPFAKFGKDVAASVAPTTAATKALEAYRKEVQTLRDTLSGASATAELRQLADAFKGLPPALQANQAVLQRTWEAFQKLEKALGGAALPKDLQAFVAALRAAVGPSKELTTQVQALERSLAAVPLAPLDGFTLERPQREIERFLAANDKLLDRIRTIETNAGALGPLGGGIGLEKPKATPIPGGFAASIAGALGDFPKLLQQAFTGGGGLGGALNAIAAKIGGDLFGKGGALESVTKAASAGLTKVFGKTIGDALGAAIPGIGALLGPAIQGLLSLFKKPEFKKVAADVGRDLGVTLSEGLAQEIAALEKSQGLKRMQAVVYDLSKVIQEAGGLNAGNFAKFAKQLRDTFVFFERGEFNAAQAAKVLDDNFAAFVTASTDGLGLIGDEMREVIGLAQRFGIESKAIGEFISGQVKTNVVGGLAAFAGASAGASKSVGELQDKLVGLRTDLVAAEPGSDKQQALQAEIAKTTQGLETQRNIVAATAITSQAAADALSASVAVAFVEMQKAGIPIAEIVAELDPVIAGLAQKFTDAGFTGGAAFQKIQEFSALARDEIAGPVIQAVTGLGQTLVGLSNIGALNQDTFSGLTEQIAASYAALEAAGKGGPTALALLQQPLQQIYALAQDFGYSVDEATQALLDQATEAGVVGDKMRPVQEQMLKATERIAAAVEALAQGLGYLPSVAARAADGMQSALDGVRAPVIRPRIEFETAGGPPLDFGENTFAGGSGGIRDFGAGTPALLHGREGVFTTDEIAEIAGGGARRGVEVTVNTHASFQVQAIDADSFRDAMRDKVIPLLKDEFRLNTNGLLTTLNQVLA